MTALTTRTALQVQACVALLAVAVAAAIIALVLTQPGTAAAALAQHDYGGVAAAVGRELAGWLHALLRYL